MRLAGDYVFDGPREDVWDLMRDPEVLATALPGTQSLTRVSENEYTGAMHVRVGPVSGVFSGRVAISDEVPPESYTLTVEGKGGPAFVKATGSVRLTEQGSEKTLLEYEGEFQVGGRLVSVGQRLLDSVSRGMIRQGLDKLNEALRQRLAARGEG